MNASEVFAANLALIDRVIAAVCQRGRLYGADAEDFASVARLALMENDYAVLRKWEGRSSLGGYLTAVLQRLLIDERVRVHGRWHQSAEAQRMGPAGVLLETLLRRDRRSIDEAFPAIRAIEPAMTRADVEAMASRLPARVPRPRPVDLEVVESFAVAVERADRRALSAEDERLAQRAAAVIREVAASLPPEERTMLELRFARNMSAPAIARAMNIPQRTLYRRIDAVLGRLRTALTRAGLGAGALGSVLEGGCDALDFGFAQWRTQAIGPSDEEQRPAAAEESKS